MDRCKSINIIGGIRYKFMFRSDSFYLKRHEETDVHMSSPCRPTLFWDEFYSGIFRFDKDSIYLSGERTDSLNIKLFETECIRNMKFTVSYKYEFRSDTLVFLPREYQRPANANDPVFIKKYEFFLLFI
jgi:hypothetical protein